MVGQGKITRDFFNHLVIFLFSVAALHAQDTEKSRTNKSAEQILETAKRIRHQNPDSSMILLQEAHEKFIKKGDTVQAINTLLEMPHIYGQRVNYANSYDMLWHALFLADDSKNDTLKASIYGQLGRLYSFFKRKEKAFEYLNTSLGIKKNLVNQGLMSKANLVENSCQGNGVGPTTRKLSSPTRMNFTMSSVKRSKKRRCSAREAERLFIITVLRRLSSSRSRGRIPVTVSILTA